MEYNFTDQKTHKKFDVKVDPKEEYGCFEHHEHGEDLGGGLWFSGKELVDYDGVFELPSEVCEALREMGYNPEYAE